MTALRACLGVDTELFYPGPEDRAGTRLAKSICNQCCIRDQCLQQALETDERFGIWGGTTAEERAKLTGKTRARYR